MSANGSRPSRRNPGGRSCLVVLAALALAMAVLTGTAAAASAHPRPACTSFYDWGTGLHNDEQGGFADWESNPCGFTLQTRAICVSFVTGGVYHHDSGEVRGLEIQAWATCNLLDCLSTFQVDPQDTGNWITKTSGGCGPRRRDGLLARLAGWGRDR